jgi:cobalamin biosynthetic protein CobC
MTLPAAANPPIAHGGRLLAARRRFPDAPEPFLDLSTGINPVAYPLPPLPPAAWARLPEPEELDRLQMAAAVAYGVADPAMVVAAPGTQLLITLLPRLWPLRSVAILGPTYAEHAASWRAVGSAVTEVDDAARLGTAEGAVLCNPNNPDGRILPNDMVRALADQLARGGLLVVDEAFADLEGVSVAPQLPHPALVVLRSFGKTFGLAGLRLGFALASPDRAAAIRSALGPWAVSGPAIAIGCRALADAAWLAEARARLARDAAALDACLIAAGLRIVGGTRLFRLAATPDAAAIYHRLGRAGILVRRFGAHPGWLRFGLPGDATALARLAAALASAP